MKPTKMRNQQLYRATYAAKSAQVSSPLSNDLQKKYGKKSIRVREGDSVRVVRGEYRGIDGKIASVLTEAGKVAIEGVKREKTRGDKFDVHIHASNIVVTDINDNDKWRIKKTGDQKYTTHKDLTQTEEKQQYKHFERVPFSKTEKEAQVSDTESEKVEKPQVIDEPTDMEKLMKQRAENVQQELEGSEDIQDTAESEDIQDTADTKKSEDDT